MNILFLIGNGFDINIGLNTRFKDALNFYLEERNDDPRIVKFKKDITQDFENWSDFETQMGVYTENFNSQDIDDYCFCIKNFRESLIQHLKNEELCINYNSHKEEIISIFSKSIFEFYNKLTLSSKNILGPFVRNNSISYNFMTFNYTDVFDKCIGVLKTNAKTNANINTILHIHGTTKENVIMGIDNMEQIKNEELKNNTKLGRVIIKPIINKKLKQLNDNKGLELIKNSHIICIFGLSLGETDKTWWQTVGNWLKFSNERHVVIFNVVKEWNRIHPEDSIENEENLIENFCLASGIAIQEQEKYSGRIHIGFNTDMFKLDLTK